MDLFNDYIANRKEREITYLSFEEYLALCEEDHMTYASPAERMIKAIGDPVLIDTSQDPRLSRIFLNKTIRQYPAFSDFYGMEDTIEKVVGYFKHAAQGLEEKKQILYLLGPVGGGKSSLAERIKMLAEQFPIYTLVAEEGDHKDKISPCFESPLGLFAPELYGAKFKEDYNIPERYLTGLMSPWAVKRLKEFGNDVGKFKIAKIYPTKLEQIGIVKTEPGDENNQDISNLVGKTDIRMLEYYSQDDTDSYSYSGALCRGNQGIMEFVEMFKAPIKVLHPLLTATQEGNYIGTEGLSAIPFQGVVLAHSNESEWQRFKNDSNNEAFIDRVFVVKVPYCLRTDEELRIYEKMLSSTDIDSTKCAPETLAMLAKFCVLTRLRIHDNSTLLSKLRVYNGENIKDVDPKAKSMQEYKDTAGMDEGMDGISTRFAFKVLSQTFNFDPTEVAADPIHLMFVLEDKIRREQFGKEKEDRYIDFIKTSIAPKYAEFIGNEIQKSYLESYGDYGQNLFDRYIEYADSWIQDIDFKDPDTGNLMDRKVLNDELEKIEKPAGIANPKDFRNEVVNFVIRAKASNEGKNPKWTSYEKLREIIEKKMFASTEELLPIISFTAKSNTDDEKKHTDFVNRMEEKGYTERQVRRLVEWYMRVNKAS
tara:strand:- start:2150 stop:4099 length:1950 start_codon:yes stop_codon:yes gene_type:complete